MTKQIPWNTGDGNITLAFNGQGNDSVIVASDINNLNVARSQILTFTGGGITRQVVVNQAAKPEPANYVDFDLPSGLLWAKCNVGATVETDCGEYYKWGSIVPYPNGDYDTMGSGTLPLTEDAAHVNMGGGWRMPTYADAQELIDNTVGTKTTVNGITGCKFSKTINGIERYIFIPFGGRNNDGNKSFMATWLSTSADNNRAYKLYCISNNNYVPVISYAWHSGKKEGMNVRGVFPRS